MILLMYITFYTVKRVNQMITTFINLLALSTLISSVFLITSKYIVISKFETYNNKPNYNNNNPNLILKSLQELSNIKYKPDDK